MSENQNQSNAVSVYGQEGLDDFPVLKAFQQYIDAEQIKSRKRMVALSVFFAVLMTLVIAIFLFVLKDVSEKNQSLNDRLLEYVMRDRDRQPVVVQPAAAVQQTASGNEAALKAMTETLVALQKQIVEQGQAKAAPQPAAVAEPERPTREQSDLQKKLDSDAEKLKKAQEQLKAERVKMAAEKERLRKEEIELHRRRLYPEYYARLDAEAAAATGGEKAAAAPAVRPAKPAAKPAERPSAARKSGPIDYFAAYGDDDEDVGAGGLTDEELDNLLPPSPPDERQTPLPAVTSAPVKPAAAKPAASQPPKKPLPAKAKPQEKDPDKRPAGAETVNIEINGAESDWLIPAD